MAGVDDVSSQSLGFFLSALGFAVSRRFHEVLAPLGLEPREFALLRAAAAAEGQTQQALAERLGVPPSRMVAFLDALEGRGLIERRANPADRRARALYLTSAGHELLGRAFAEALEFEGDLCADLPAGAREQLLELLALVGSRLGLETGPLGSHAHPALTAT